MEQYKREELEIEMYKRAIKALIEVSQDIDYLVAVYTFAGIYKQSPK